jgi:hypothetical protein
MSLDYTILAVDFNSQKTTIVEQNVEGIVLIDL